jgi:RHS repeat-associated protein
MIASSCLPVPVGVARRGSRGSRVPSTALGFVLAILAALLFGNTAAAQLTPASATVAQAAVAGFSYGTCNSQQGSSNQWQATLSSSAAGTVQTTNPGATCWGGLFTAAYAPGTYTLSLSSAGTVVGTATITVMPLGIAVTGPTTYDENGYYSQVVTATLSGMGSFNSSDYAMVWSISPLNDMTLSAGSVYNNTSSETILTGVTAGSYVLTATSAREPAVSGSLAITVVAPVVTVTPTSAVAIPGQTLTFNCTDSNVPPPIVPGCDIYSTDPWIPGGGGGAQGPVQVTVPLGHPGGTFQLLFEGAWGGQATATLTVVAVSLTPAAIVVPPGTSRQFFGDVTGSQQALQWSTTVPGATISSQGLLTVPAGTVAGSYTVTAQTVGNPVSPASAAVTVASTVPVTGVVVSPASSVIPSGQQEPFSATVLGQNDEPDPNQAVTWSISGPAAASMGASGLFTGPATPGVYTVTATSQANPALSGSATVTVGEDLLILPASASLAPAASQQFTAQVSGVAGPAVTWSVEEGAAGGAVSTAGLYTAPATPGVYHVVALSSAAGETVQGIATVSVSAAPQISIAVSPSEAAVAAGGTQPFTATVTGAASSAVTWSASAGTIDATGLFTAPAGYGTVTITATSQAYPQVQASATVVVSTGAAGQAFQYDANGNLLSDGMRTYEWDAENRLTAVNIGTHRSEFGYDGLGRRAMIVEINSGTVVSKRHYIWIGDQIVEERDATATSATIPTTIASTPPPVTSATMAAEATMAAMAALAPASPSAGDLATVQPRPDAAPTPAGDNAVFVAQTVPATMVAGGVYSVSIAMSNTGTTTWTAAANYRLGSSNPQNNTTWGLERAYLASTDAIAPGQQKTFTFNVTAPATAGIYNFQWQILEENVAWIGNPTTNLAITVTSGSAANLAQFIAQSVPATMVAGGVYTVSITLQNAGTNVWTTSSNHHLGSQDPEDNTTWRGNRVLMSTGDSIAQGQQKTFTFTVTAPATAGTYNFQWQMVQDGVAWFGDLTPVVAVSVASGADAQLAQFISQTVPTGMSVGVSYSVSITMENAGTATWTAAASYRLGSSNPQNNVTWGLERVYLAASDAIAQGQEKTFTFTITAPAAPGTYNFQWQMVQDGVAWFGTVTPNVPISVVVPVEPVVANFFQGGMQYSGANYYFSYDHLGSIREVTDVNGNVVARYDYDPYGRLTVNLGASFEFAYAGYYYHQPSGLYLTKYRAYDPNVGRWASRDLEPLNLDKPYAYADNDPADLIDPDGLTPRLGTPNTWQWFPGGTPDDGQWRLYGDDGWAKWDEDWGHQDHHPDIPDLTEPHGHRWDDQVPPARVKKPENVPNPRPKPADPSKPVTCPAKRSHAAPAWFGLPMIFHFYWSLTGAQQIASITNSVSNLGQAIQDFQPQGVPPYPILPLSPVWLLVP